MIQNRRTFLHGLSAVLAHAVLAPLGLSAAARSLTAQDLRTALNGTWSLVSYTYTSNNETYVAPEQMEATATFADGKYNAEFTAHIRAVGITRTRRASESGTFSIDGARVRLFAEEASDDGEKGEEFLTSVAVKDNTMTLTSNNGITTEVWKKAS